MITQEVIDTSPYEQELSHIQLSMNIDFLPNSSLVNASNTGNPRKIKTEYKCTMCSKIYKRKARQQIHIRTHYGCKPFECLQCGKKFNEKGNLTIHMRIHTGEKPYKCTYEGCSKTFRAYGHLSDHINRHLDLRPFTCEICKSSFGRSHTLKTHMLVHSGEKPYMCSVCKKKFSEKGNMKTHMKIHTKQFGRLMKYVDSISQTEENDPKHKLEVNMTYEFSYFANNLNSSFIPKGSNNLNFKQSDRYDLEKYFDKEESESGSYHYQKNTYDFNHIMNDNISVNSSSFHYDL